MAIQNVGIAAITIAIAVLIAFRYKPKEKEQFSINSVAHAIAVAFEKIVAIAIPIPSFRRAIDPINGANTVAQFPLQWNQDEGEYTLEFTIGDTTIKAVPDTGSMFLVVGSDKCESCDERQGKYDRSGVDTGESKQIVYGSQTDAIEWFVDDIIVRGLTEPLNIEFGAVTDVSGPSNLNVFGLAGSETFGEKTPLIDQLMFQQQILAPAFHFNFMDKNAASLTLGARASSSVKGYTVDLLSESQVKSELGADLGFNFYIIRLKGIKLDGNPVEAPKYAMLDSGSTALVCSNKLSTSLNTGFNGGAQSIEFEFQNFSLSFTNEVAGLVDHDPTFDSAPFSDVLIFGNQLWAGRIWSFDLQNKALTVATSDPMGTT